MRRLKGSEYRKRYVAVYSERLASVLPALEKELFRTFRSKRKYLEGKYAIFLTNQFYRDQILETIRNNFKGVETIITSGTIRKCKSVIAEHRENLRIAEKEVSTLL